MTDREATLPATGTPIPLRQKQMVPTALPERIRTYRGARLSKKPKSQIPKQKVFQTYELTEHILSFLPPRDIFVCQRISKTFKTVTDDSHALQELMFLRRTGAPRQTWQIANLDTKIDGHGQGITSVDPAARVALLKFPRVHVPHVQHFVKPHLTLTPAIMNGLLLRSPAFNDRERNLDTLSRNKCDYIMLMPEFCILCGPKCLKRKNILSDFKQDWSLLNTYLTNPPCRRAWITYTALRFPSKIYRIDLNGLLEVETGITMGHVLNAPYSVRGVVEFQRLVGTEENERELPAEVYDNVILGEVLESLYGEDGEPVDLYGHFRCDFLDTIIPTERMLAGVAPYVETDGEPKYSRGADYNWASSSNESSDEEDEQDADEESDSEEADSEEARGEEAECEEADEDLDERRKVTPMTVLFSLSNQATSPVWFFRLQLGTLYISLLPVSFSQSEASDIVRSSIGS